MSAETRRILHREKPDGRTIEFVLGVCDELLADAQAAIPFDNPTAWGDWIKKCVDSGELQAVTISLDNRPIGSLTFGVVGNAKRELLITSAHITDHSFGYIPCLNLFCDKLAREMKCEFIRFHTVRKGLVKQAILCGFNVSEFVLRKPVSPCP